MSNPEAQAPQPAGWYPDMNGDIRWWDGTSWTAQTQNASGPAVSAYERPRLPEGTKVDTGWTWVVALATFVTVPFLFFMDMRGFVAASLEAAQTGNDTAIVAAVMGFMGLILLMSAVAIASTVLTIVAAYRDYKHLVSVGVQRPFHWGFSFLILVVGIFVYLIGRHVVLRKVTRTAGWPLWTHLALLVATFVVSTIWAIAVMQSVMGQLPNFM
jgi:hypothetical protein